MPDKILFGSLVNSNAPVSSTVASRTLTFVYGPEHQRLRQDVLLAAGQPSQLAAGAGTTWYLNGEDNLGLTYERFQSSVNGSIENRHYLSAGGMVFALHTTKTSGSGGAAAPTTSLRYMHHDHLGSIAAISNEAGQVVERLAYDPWGKRRYATGLPDSQDQLVGVNTDRGYTLHEHLDEVGVIHMNGRIYDPLMGRFMSADPFIQAPGNLQSYDRYSYVMNNPLAFTDPSGYWSFKQLFRVAAVIAVGYFTGGAISSWLINSAGMTGSAFVTMSGGTFLSSAGSLSALGSAVAGAGGGFLAGAVGSGTLKGAMQGALSGGLFGAAGSIGGDASMGRYAAHAAAGCISSVAGGASCDSGAASALFGKFSTNALSGIQSDIARGVAATVAGGIGSSLAGGKFANGAETAAYGYLFNQLLSIGARLGSAAMRLATSRPYVFAQEIAAAEIGLATPGASLLAAKGFSSFDEFKQAVGSAGANRHWHHIVEQHEDNVVKFGSEALQTAKNMVNIDAGLHQKISGFYNSNQLIGFEYVKVRDYVKTLSYDMQRTFGLNVLHQLSK